MSNPIFDQKSIKKRKAPGIDIIAKDTSQLVEPIGVHNSVAPNLADGDWARFQMDDMGNLNIVIGDPAVIADLKKVEIVDSLGNSVSLTNNALDTYIKNTTIEQYTADAHNDYSLAIGGKDTASNVKPILVDTSGRTIIVPRNVTSATNTKISVGLSSTQVLASNTSRVSVILVNDSDETIYVSLSGTAVMNEGIRLNANGGSLIETEYTGVITAICASGSKNLTVVEK